MYEVDPVKWTVWLEQDVSVERHWFAKWTVAYINDLPDAAFAIIKPGGEKDEEGKTVPRTLRMLPHHNESVKSPTENESVDIPHLRNALARVNQPGTDLSDEQRSQARRHLEAHARALNVGEAAEEEVEEEEE